MFDVLWIPAGTSQPTLPNGTDEQESPPVGDAQQVARVAAIDPPTDNNAATSMEFHPLDLMNASFLFMIPNPLVSHHGRAGRNLEASTDSLRIESIDVVCRIANDRLKRGFHRSRRA